MIEISLTQALTVYSGLLGLTIGAIWLYTELSVRRPQRHLGKQFLWRCTFCRCTYLDERAQRISQCPRCESLNSAEEATAWGQAATPDATPAESVAGPTRNTSRRKRRHQRRRGPRRRR